MKPGCWVCFYLHRAEFNLKMRWDKYRWQGQFQGTGHGYCDSSSLFNQQFSSSAVGKPFIFHRTHHVRKHALNGDASCAKPQKKKVNPLETSTRVRKCRECYEAVNQDDKTTFFSPVHRWQQIHSGVPAQPRFNWLSIITAATNKAVEIIDWGLCSYVCKSQMQKKQTLRWSTD